MIVTVVIQSPCSNSSSLPFISCGETKVLTAERLLKVGMKRLIIKWKNTATSQ